MLPAICDGDTITVAPVGIADLQPGCIAVYRRDNRLIAHRVMSVEGGETDRPVLLLRGDAAADCDVPVEVTQILGTVVTIERTGAGRLVRGVRLLFQIVRARLGVISDPIPYLSTGARPARFS